MANESFDEFKKIQTNKTYIEKQKTPASRHTQTDRGTRLIKQLMYESAVPRHNAKTPVLDEYYTLEPDRGQM